MDQEEKPTPQQQEIGRTPLIQSSRSAVPEALAAAPSLPKTFEETTSEGKLTKKREFLWQVHAYTNDYVRFADTKAAFCVGIASALIGVLFASKSHELFIQTMPVRFVGDCNYLAYISMGAFILLIFSIAASVLAVRPRLWTYSEEGFIFWGAIANFKDPDIFTARYQSQTEEELSQCLSHHLYSLATVCRRKYYWVNAAIMSVAGGGALAIAVLLLKH